MVAEVNLLSDCWLCSHALLCPDGRLRCGDTLSATQYTFTLAQELCNGFESGGFKLYKPEPPDRLKITGKLVKPIKSIGKLIPVRRKTQSTSQRRMM